MARLDINFAAPAQPRSRGGLGWVLLLAGACASTVAWLDWEDATEARLAAEAASRSRPAPARAGNTRAGTPAVAPETLQAARKAQNALSRPWEAVLAGMENATTPQVALLSVEAQADTRLLRLLGEARDMPALADWVNRLGQQPGLQGVVLVSHEAQSEGAATWLRFAVDARWGPTP